MFMLNTKLKCLSLFYKCTGMGIFLVECLAEKAYKEHDIPLIVKLLKHNFETTYIFTRACELGYIDLVDYIIINNNCSISDGLHKACLHGQIDVVQMLIQHLPGPRFHVINDLLLSACEGGHIEVVKLLVENGASHYHTALCHLAMCYKYYRKEKYLHIIELICREIPHMFYGEYLQLGNEFSIYRIIYYHYLKYISMRYDIHRVQYQLKYNNLVEEQDPMYTIITYYNNNPSLQRLPIDLWRMTNGFLC